VTRAASVQFLRPFLFRVIKLHDWPTYHGWCWLEGYELDSGGEAVSKRQLYVRLAGLQPTRSAAHTVRARRSALARTAVRVG
jgi:hypothetical protein